MSSEKSAVARQIVERLNARDAEGLAGLLHPEYEFYSLLASVEGKAYRGVDGLREYFAEIEHTWEDMRFELEEFHEAGGQTIVVIHLSGRARASGVPLDQRTHQVWSWREGKVWRTLVSTDPAEAREAAGL